MAAKKIIELPVLQHQADLPHGNCEKCDLHRETHRPFFQPVRHTVLDADGAQTNRVLVITDFPDWRDQGAKGAVGPSGYYHRGFVQFKREILDGLECSWTYTSVARCPVDPRKNKPKPKQYEACEEAFLRQIVMEEKPRSVICLGKEALNSMCRIAGLLPPKSVNDVKGSYIIAEELNLRIYSAEHQSAYVQRDTNIDALEKHYYGIFSKAEAHALDTEYREKIKYNVARTPQDVAKLAALRFDRNEFAVDVETNYPLRDRKGTKDWKRNSIYKENTKCISLSVTHYDTRLKDYVNTVIIEEGLKDPVVLRRLFEDRVAIMHNGSFDANAIHALLDVDVFDHKRGVRDWQDTRLCFYLSDQNRLFTALKDLARHYIPNVGDWEDEGDALITKANMMVAQERQNIKEAMDTLKSDLEKWRVYEKGIGQVLIKAEKAKWTRAAKHVLDKNYKSEVEIIRTLNTYKERLRKLPQPGLCSFDDIPITKLCEYNAEDTLRTLQLWREVIPQMEAIDGFTYDRDCYEMMKEMIRTACYVQREGFNVNKDKLEALEEKLLGREEEIRQALLPFERVKTAVEAVKDYQKALKASTEPVWTKVMSVKNETFMGTLAKNYGVYHLGNKTDHKVTFGKLVLPVIKDHFEKKLGKDSEEYQVFDLLEELRESMDTRSKFLNSWKQWICPDSRFHCDFKLIANQNIGYARGKDAAGGAQSGRSSCIAEGSFIECPRDVKKYPNGIPIEEVQVGEMVYAYDEKGNLRLDKVTAKYDNGVRDTVILNWSGTGRRKKSSVTLTPEHLVCKLNGDWVRADSLKKGDRVRSLGRSNANGYQRLHVFGDEEYREHRWIRQHLDGNVGPKDHVHHMDENKINNHPSNLQTLNYQEHGRLHYSNLTQEEKDYRTKFLLDYDKSLIRRPTGEEHSGWLPISRFSLLRGLAQCGGGPKKLSIRWGVDYETVVSRCKLYGVDYKAIAKRYNRVGDFMSRGLIQRSTSNDVPNLDVKARELRIGYRALKALIGYYGIQRNHVVESVVTGPKVRVWDLTVENSHNFFANEINVHNCSKPNLQQVTKDEILREVFEPPAGFFIAECDYKSLEPMLMAYVTGCDRLKQVFWRALDIYRVTCNDMYHKGVDLDLPDDVVRARLADPAVVSDVERKKFKTGFLAWVYGAGKYRLASVLKVSEDEAADFIKRAEQTYFEIFEWKNSIRDVLREGGAIYTYTGRRRTFPIAEPADYSEEERERARKDFGTAFRVAVNFPIQCLPEGSQVLTKSGYRAIETCNGLEVWDGERWASCLLHGGEDKPLFEIKTNSGNIKLSPKHRVETQRGWVEAQRLERGDRILRKDALAPEGDYWGSEDLAEFLGMMIGDGNYSQPHKSSTLVVGSKEDDVLTWLEPRLRLWNAKTEGKEKKGSSLWNVRRRFYKTKHSYSIVSVKTPALRLLSDKGLKLGVTAYDKAVPASVFTARPEVRAAVLRGLYNSDGGIIGDGTNGFQIPFTTVSEQLAYDAHRLASSLGIQTRIERQKNTQCKKGAAYKVIVMGHAHEKFAEIVGFRGMRKARLLDVIVAHKECMDESKKKRQEYAVVKEVVDHGVKVKMWDLQVNSDRHAFVVDGLSVHNSLGSDITLVQAAKVRRWIEKNNYFDVVKMVNLVHDSIYFYVKETHAHLLLEIIKIMEDVSHFKFKIDVPLTVEYTLGYNYAESMGLDHQKENQDRLRRKFGLIEKEAA